MKIVAGDYAGFCVVDNGVLWTGPRADKFYGLKLGDAVRTPEQIKRVKEISAEQTRNFAVGAAGAAVGAVALGPAGLLAGAISLGRGKAVRVGIEFTDGSRVVVEDNAQDKGFLCFWYYCQQAKLIDIDF